LMRSYDHVPAQARPHDPINYGPTEKMHIWQVARAATAAPMNFKEIKVHLPGRNGDQKTYFSDGGFGVTNNPTQVALIEMMILYGATNVGAIISIGTARAPETSSRDIFGRVRKMASVATNPETVAEWMRTENPDCYWRFNDKTGLRIELDEWKPNGLFTKKPGHETLRKIQASFDGWAR
jgi:patatin-like phospholipase/acyl hydrolase